MEAKVFVNDDIFQSDGDYVIGGFVTDKVDGFTVSDFKAQLALRVAKLIDEYLERASLYNIELGIENPSEEAKNDLALVLQDNLDIAVPYTDKETIINSILNDDRVRTWTDGIALNIQSLKEYNVSKYRGVYNQSVDMNLSSNEYMMAKYFTEETTLEQLVEQISMIEL